MKSTTHRARIDGPRGFVGLVGVVFDDAGPSKAAGRTDWMRSGWKRIRQLRRLDLLPTLDIRDTPAGRFVVVRRSDATSPLRKGSLAAASDSCGSESSPGPSQKEVFVGRVIRSKPAMTTTVSLNAQSAANDALWIVREARAAILPAVVAEGLIQYEADVRDLFVVDGRCAQARLDACIRTRVRVTESMRFCLAVEPLSRQTVERIGVDEIAKSLAEWHARHQAGKS